VIIISFTQISAVVAQVESAFQKCFWRPNLPNVAWSERCCRQSKIQTRALPVL